MTELFDISPRDKAVEGILWLIQSEGLKGGDQLPAERVLQERLGVSRTALRGAIASLSSAHVLESRVGSGTYVRPKPPINIFQRSRAFSDAVRQAGMEPSTRVVHVETYDVDEKLAQKFEVKAGTPVMELCRLRMADDMPVAVETTYVNRTLAPDIQNNDFQTVGLYEVLERDYGLRPKHSHERISVTQANAEEAELLGIDEGTPVFYERGLEMNKDGVPIEYFKAAIVPSRFRFANDEVWGKLDAEIGDAWLMS